jgi:hypothetical protein
MCSFRVKEQNSGSWSGPLVAGIKMTMLSGAQKQINTTVFLFFDSHGMVFLQWRSLSL